MRRTVAGALLSLTALGCAAGRSVATAGVPTPGAALAPMPVQVESGLTVASPAAGELVTSPLAVTGRTAAWEVLVAVCDANGVELGRGFAAIGCQPAAVPYRTTVAFAAPTTATGYVTASGKTEEGGPGGGCGAALRVAVRFTALSFTG